MKNHMRGILAGIIFLLVNQRVTFAQRVSVSVDWPPSNFAYVGADNSLSVTVEGVSCRSVMLSTDNGVIVKDRCHNYTFRPDHPADSKIIVSKKSGKKTRKIREFFIGVRVFPDPVAWVGGLNKGSIAKDALRVQTGIGASSPANLNIDIKYQVRSYSVSVVRNTQLLFFTRVDGYEFNPEIHERFKDLQKDDIVLFSSIMVQLPDEKQTLVQPFELKIE